MEAETTYINPIDNLKKGVNELLNILTDHFPKDIQESIVASKVIIIHDDRYAKLSTPKADLIANQITIQDTHLSFIWCCSYIMVAMNSMYYEKAALNQSLVSFNDIPEFMTVQRTLGWAKSLKHEVTMWPNDIARPDKTDKWVEQATTLFQPCVAYFIYHELGHLLLHKELIELKVRQGKADYIPNDIDSKRMYDAEVQADQFALDCLLAGSVDPAIRMTKYHAATLAHLSNFFLLDTPDTRGFTHPDLDIRLRSVLNEIELTDEASKIQLGAHMSMGLQLFFAMTGKELQIENPNFENFEQLEEHLFSLIDSMKAASRGKIA